VGSDVNKATRYKAFGGNAKASASKANNLGLKAKAKNFAIRPRPRPDVNGWSSNL